MGKAPSRNDLLKYQAENVERCSVGQKEQEAGGANSQQWFMNKCINKRKTNTEATKKRREWQGTSIKHHEWWPISSRPVLKLVSDLINLNRQDTQNNTGPLKDSPPIIPGNFTWIEKIVKDWHLWWIIEYDGKTKFHTLTICDNYR